MDVAESLYVTTRSEWRSWLEANHTTQNEIWLVFYKKHTGNPTISYNDAVEEAICFGWIDSIIKRIDDEKFVRKFTPRRDTRRWSSSNIDRIKKMINQGKMTEAGLQKIDELSLERGPEPRKEFTIPTHVEEALKAHPEAWNNFVALAPGYRRQYLGWVVSAKKEETQKRRLAELITVLENNEKLGMK
ncbi:MAG: YdeI/OmpD-associated family protein [Theionarchaea archaeon]|nr:YdeI/OmpD-associated family protein [Theionarchaea archaeon]MBU7000884.1 YdeI/OmpD-associated family protein [Theionarchaea archaeon]MBU7021926.1 YdeI/OmpD-associated family protein [Theionarchaea archaeon]MBU7035538.1 YdeI/OmpD-associated family protein [Theionarchaea archaeon]MBU7040376.1 YdeI/OmpD-associated family protein [Theionarchaea archaeon]